MKKMKKLNKRWLLFLLFTAVLFSPCQKAQASDIDGTWRIMSGEIEEEEYGDRWEGFLSYADPDEFSIRVVERSSGLYSMVLNYGEAIYLEWTYTEYPRGDNTIGGSLSTIDYLVQNTEGNYSYNFTDNEGAIYSYSIVLLDSYTLRFTIIEELPGYGYWRYEYNLERTGWDPYYYLSEEESTGCDAGAGVWALVLILPIIKLVRRKSGPHTPGDSRPNI